jgi:hypothetical protein
MHALFINGEIGRRKVWIREGAHRYSYVVYVVAFD